MTDEVLFSRAGPLGLILLNRPQALNALNWPMCTAIHAQLDAWRDDAGVRAVVVRGAGDRAFCAGGDVIGIRNAGLAGSSDWENFFHDEYRMNHAIATYPKPYIALVDGIFMGGGVGVSVHGPIRVATEKTLFAMPETGIGLIPDVGGTHFMPRLPGQTGMYLALSGDRLKAGDCVALNVCTHFVPSTRIDALVEALADGDLSSLPAIGALIGRFADDAGPAPVAAHRAEIDRYFDGESVEAIVAALAGGGEWAQAVRTVLLKMSPTSLKLTFRAMRAGAHMDIAGCLTQEYRIVCGIKAGHDFFEGVRAQLVDKDRNPQWRPATLETVDPAEIDRHFQPPAWGDLILG